MNTEAEVHDLYLEGIEYESLASFPAIISQGDGRNNAGCYSRHYLIAAGS